MKIPSILKIGGHYVSIHVTEDITDCGTFDIIKNEIRLNKKQEQTQLEATLIHEIIHALNITLSDDHVEFLAQGLYQVIKDNDLVFDGKKIDEKNTDK